MHKHEFIASASSSRPKWLFQFYNAKHLYNRKKQRLPGETWMITPPHDMTYIWQRGPLQQICKLKFQVSPLDGTYYANISSLQKSTTRWNKQKQHRYIKTTRLYLKQKIPTTRKVQSQVIKSPNHLKIEQNTNTPSLKLCMPHQALLT